jgi:hypothetical protein
MTTEADMKKNALKLLFLFLALFTVLPAVFADISGNIYTAGVGKYFWRGQILDDGAALQPGASVTLNKFTFDWWGSYSFTSGQLGESDYRVSFADTIPFIPLTSFSAGYWMYTYPYLTPGPNNTQELFASISVDVPSQPVITYYYDSVLLTKYLELGFTHEMELLGFGVNAGLTGGYDLDVRTFTALQGTLGISYSMGGFKLNPAFTGQIALGKNYISASTWSVNLSYEFDIAEETRQPEK